MSAVEQFARGQLYAVGYIDTIGYFWGTYPPHWLLAQLRGQYGKNLVRPKKSKYFQDGRWITRGWRMEINQPTVATLRQLAEFQYISLDRVDLACDFLCDRQQEADELQAWLDQHCVQKWRHSGTYSRRCYGTSYSNVNLKARCGIVRYADRKSKVTSTPCAHVEPRFFGSPACRGAGLSEQNLIAGIDLRALLHRKTKLMSIDTERRYNGLVGLERRLRTTYRMRPEEAARRAEGWICKAAYCGEDSDITIDDLYAQELYDNRLTRRWLKPMEWHLPQIEWHSWDGTEPVIIANNAAPPIDLSNDFPEHGLQNPPYLKQLFLK